MSTKMLVFILRADCSNKEQGVTGAEIITGITFY